MWAQWYTQENSDAFDKVACEYTIGTADSFFLAKFAGPASMDDAAATGYSLYDLNSSEYGQGSDFTSTAEQMEDGDWYYHACFISLEIPKEDRDYGIFGEYDVKLGARYYADPS